MTQATQHCAKAVSRSAEVTPQLTKALSRSAEVTPQLMQVQGRLTKVTPQLTQVMGRSAEITPQLEHDPDSEAGQTPLMVGALTFMPMQYTWRKLPPTRDKLEASKEPSSCGSAMDTKECTEWGIGIMFYPESVTLVQECAQVHGGLGAHYAKLTDAKIWSFTNLGDRLRVRETDDRRTSGSWDTG